MHRFANPKRFLKIADAVLPWVCGAMLLAFGVGLYLALFASPPDYQQGDSVRIMYIHVPAAWMALFSYISMAVASAVALIWKHPLAYISAKAAAPIGACFTVICLATGSLWGKPMWGTWWVWDARLTSTLVLLFLFIGVMALRSAMENRQAAGRATAILAVVGVINLPIIKFSVNWWNTLHQSSSFTLTEKPAMPPEMWMPLLVMVIGFYLFLFVALILGMRNEILRRESRTQWVKQWVQEKSRNAV